MTGEARRYSSLVRRMAVSRVVAQGRPLAGVAQELGIDQAVLRAWVTQEVPPITPQTLDECRRRIRGLERELARVRCENEFLMEAAMFFAHLDEK